MHNEVPRRPGILIWDWPVRVFHWLIVLLLLGSYLTVAVWRDFDMQSHKLFGYTILGLVLFRLLWGLAGGRHARFFSFVKGPGAIFRHIGELGRRRDPGHGGHNALGALSVLALLASLLVQTVSGLFNSDDVLAEGPLFGIAGPELRSFMGQVHEINFTVLLVLIGLHLAAILFYVAWKGQALVSAMIHGRRRDLAPEEAGTSGPLWAVLLCAALAAGIVLVVVLVVPGWFPSGGDSMNFE
jgi:cytochrome b